MKVFAKSKKFLALLLVTIVCTSAVLSGCSSKGKTDSDKSGSSTNESNSKYEKGAYKLPIVKEPIEIKWMGRDSEEPGMSFLSNKSLVWEEIQKDTGIKIVWDVVPNQEYKQIMQVRLSSRADMPDIICLQGEADGSFLSKYQSEGVIVGLNNLIKDYAPNIQKVFNDYPQYKNALTVPNGEVVALGGDLSATKYRTKGVSIRKDWLDKAGLKEVTNMDELYQAAKTFVDKDMNGNGQKDEFGIVAANFKEYRQLAMGFGLSLISGSGWSVRDNKVTYEFVLPEYKEFLTWMNKAYNEGILPKDFQSADNKVMNQRIAAGQAGIIGRDYITAFISYNAPDNTVQKNTPGAFWMSVDFKDTAKNKIAIPREPLATIWRSYGITESCKDKVAAIRLLDYMFAGEGKVKSVKGKEGVTYEVKNGRILTLPNYKENMGAGVFLGDSYGPKMITDESYLGVLEQKYLNDNPELKKWSQTLIDSIAGKSYAPFQSTIPSVEDAKKISSVYADLNTYVDEMYVKFITGEAPLSSFDKYVEKCKTLGCDTIKDIYQSGLKTGK